MKSGRHPKTAARWISISAIAAALMVAGDCGQRAIPRPGERSVVDTRSLETAKAISHLASTPEERDLSAQLLQLADEELDFVFSMALHEAIGQPAISTPEAKALALRVSKVEAQAKADQEQIESFSSQLQKLNRSQQKALQPQLELLQAQLQLDQNEVRDAQEDFTRAGSNQASRIQRLWDAHKAAQHGLAATAPDAVVNSAEAGYDTSNLIAQISAWYALSRKTTPLMQAREQSFAGSAALIEQHEKLELWVENFTTDRAEHNITNARSQEDPEVARLTALRRLSETKRSLADLSERVDRRQQMTNIYGNWVSLIQARERVAMTGVVRSMLWISLIVLLAPPAARTIERRMAKRHPEDQRLLSLSATAGFGMQALGVVLCLLVIFGFPQQLPTAIFGLLGAGVTVALKDLAGVLVDNRIRELLNPKSKATAAS